MANLYSFTSDLALEQDNGGINESQYVIEVDSTASDKTESRPSEANEKTSQQNLGHAYLVLFQASRSALRKAMVDIQAENVISAALRSIVAYVEQVSMDDHSATSLLRVQEAYRPLLDKIMKRSDDAAKKTAFALLDWLLMEYSHRSLVASALGADLAPPSDKKRKLAVLLAIEHVLQSRKKPRPAPKKASANVSTIAGEHRDEPEVSESGATNYAFIDTKILSDWIPLLAAIVHEDGAIASDGSTSMTRLTGIALNVCINISQILAGQTLYEIQAARTSRRPIIVVEGEDTKALSCIQHFAVSMSSIPRILKDLRTWDARNNALISAGISDTLDIIAHFNRVRSSFTRHPSDRIMESFAKAWNVISSALCQRNAILTPTATLEHTQQYLKLQDLPPSTKLVALCLLIGFSNPSVPAEHTLKNSGELRTALFALSITVLAEDDIFGKQTALSVQQALLSTISNSDLEQVKTQVVSMLDKPTELSASSVDVISKYVAVFPVVIVSELLERLRPTSGSLLAPNDLASVTRTRNAVRVVESLAEGDFFVLVLSEEGHERRVNLENTVVELLQDKDIMIRMTASQIVAMLDPTKIISKFAPELTSSKGEVRSTAELVLLECMLFQKRDGSLGDGFVALLDYMRVSLSNTIPKGINNKVKNPSQLLSKIKPSSTGILAQASKELLDALYRIIKKLGESIPSSLWPFFIERMVAKTYGSPRLQVWARVWSELAPSIANSAEAIVALSDRMVEVMEHQGPLTEDVVKDAVETNDEAFDDLQVARASPLLILKTIPAYGFARQFKTMESSSTEAGSESIPAKMTRLLKSENHLETRYARALSLAVLQGMFPSSSLETIHANLAKQLTRISDEPEQRDFEACRTWLFALHTWVMNWTTQWNTPEQTGGDVAWIYRIINDFFYRFVSIGAVKKELEQDVYKLQLAVVEILSKILLFTAPFYTKSQKNPFSKKLDGLCSKHPFSVTATIEEIPDDDSVDLRNDNDSSVTPKSLEDLFLALLGDILSFVTQPLRDCDDTSVPYAICLANVFIMTMQTFAPSSERKPDAAVRISTRDASDSSRVVPSRWIPCILMDLITPCLASSLTTLLTDPEFSPNQRYTALIQTCIQILYVGAGIAGAVEERTTSRTTNHCAMGVAVSGIESSEFAIAVGSLKLLAYMTQTKMITSDLLTDANVVAIRKGLTRLQQSKQMEANTGSEITYLLDAMWEVVA